MKTDALKRLAAFSALGLVVAVGAVSPAQAGCKGTLSAGYCVTIDSFASEAVVVNTMLLENDSSSDDVKFFCDFETQPAVVENVATGAGGAVSEPVRHALFNELSAQTGQDIVEALAHVGSPTAAPQVDVRLDAGQKTECQQTVEQYVVEATYVSYSGANAHRFVITGTVPYAVHTGLAGR
ncbi:hypothetical protein [Timonella sp. A28]|uniref:hypothetical protein n=1 Tax=Timonella sp. A28 TaxID=3442640 RepID=UPI003EBB1D51